MMTHRRHIVKITAIAGLSILIAPIALAGDPHPSLKDGQRPVVTEMAPTSPASGINRPEPFLAHRSPDQRILPPHPPIDQIPFMPMPEIPPQGVMPIGTDRSLTYHDSSTNETYALPITQSPTRAIGGQSIEGEYQGFGNPIDNAIESNRSFGNMFLINNRASWPASGNVKLVMKFTDTSGSEQWFVCSGSMQDSGVVLAAAHCVFNRNADINNWADAIYIYPAWDGINSGFEDDIENFGYAYSTVYAAGTGYVNNGDWDADASMIRITRGGSRNVGMLTGWYAWAWGGSCSTIQSRNYNNFAYPAESCPLPGLHNGRDMYFWSGTIDSCPGNQMQFITGGGHCFDTFWGGMSGSGMYYIDGSNRYMHSVASTSNRFDIANYCKLWEGFTTSLVDFENVTRGTTFDLEALKFRAGGNTTGIVAGQTLDSNASVAVINATNADPAAGSYTLRVYLSTNNNISEADTLLATWTYNTDFAPMQNRSFIVPAPTIPADTPTGTYYIGVILDSSTDTVYANNDTDTWDAQKITVLAALPDLDVIGVSLPIDTDTYIRGTTIPIHIHFVNGGTIPANGVQIEFQASLNPFLGGFDDVSITTLDYGTVNAGVNINDSPMIQIPPDLPPDDYYIGIIASEADGLDPTSSNNQLAGSFPIHVLACLPDLSGDGIINFFDVSAFLSAFSAMDPVADFNNDGLFNFFDVSSFLNAFSAGCP